VTCLTVDECRQWVPPFEATFQAQMAHWRLDGQPRTARRDTTSQHGPLPTPAERLLLILVYLSAPDPFVVWEHWLEQAQCYPAAPSNGLKVPHAGAATATHRLHHPLTSALSPELAVKGPGLLGAPDAAGHNAKAPPPDQPNRIFGEEVRGNGAAEDDLAGATLWNRTGQAQAAAPGDALACPRPAVEVKVAWPLLNSIGLDCNHLPDECTTHPVHLETIHGQCFALTGIQVMSQLIEPWI
jgi:hypothetical protein